MGNGSCCYHGYSPCQRRSKNPPVESYKYCHENHIICGLYTKCAFKFFQGRPPDWQDFVGIITLLVIKSTISFIEENNAGNAAAALMARLAPKAKVLNSITLFSCH